MNQEQYHSYLQSEIDNILQFKEEKEKSTGRRFSRNAAAAMWIARYAAAYRNSMKQDCAVAQGRLLS